MAYDFKVPGKGIDFLLIKKSAEKYNKGRRYCGVMALRRYGLRRVKE
jgi:hypothetical protein